MDSPPAANEEHVPEKIDDKKEGVPSFRCELYDIEIVRKIAQAFPPGLATASVDNTTGDIFRSPGSVAADIRKEMIAYLVRRSETFLAEQVVLEGGSEEEVSNDPYDIISDFIDEFATSKRNLFSRVSGWLLSERREDNIDDFVQEMEMSGFWLMDHREVIAQNLLKNIDFKNKFHCKMKFKTEEELAEHVENCGFRSMMCENEGCTAIFCANQFENHDSICPFKIIPCEQSCSESIMRREMDRHCITACHMKLVNCPFYAVGCQATVPQCKLQEHRLEELSSHLMHILKSIYKEASTDDLKPRVEQIQLLSSRLAETQDARSLTNQVKDIHAKLEPLEIKAKDKKNEGEKDSTEPTADASEETERKVPEGQFVAKAEEEKTGTTYSTAGSPEKAAQRAPEVEASNLTNGKEPEKGLAAIASEEDAGKASEAEFKHNASEEDEAKAQTVKDVMDDEGRETSSSMAHSQEGTRTKAPEVMIMEKDGEEVLETKNTRAHVQETAETRGLDAKVADKIGEEGTEKKNSEKAETEAPAIMVMNKDDETGTQAMNPTAYSSGQAAPKAQMS